ncbi:MAG: ATP-binding cassette domain-containing protein [Acidimicrobiia bacterium]|nr:ATP-binding cassette domain-containing protein [Acidimicrobiia bacterium]
MSIVAAENVTKRYRRGRETVTAVDAASFEVVAGQITGLVGPSGSGKTTLLDIVVGGTEPDNGRVTGLPDEPMWAELAIVPQAIGLLPELTIRENIDLPRRLGIPAPVDTDQVMTDLGIAALVDRAPDEVSLGEQQRAAIARALVASPRLLVADEPTSHQDEANVQRVVTALHDTTQTGSGVLVATHDPRVIERCDRILWMRDGVVNLH